MPMSDPQEIIRQLIAQQQQARPVFVIPPGIQDPSAQNSAAIGLGIENFYKAREGGMARQAARQSAADDAAAREALQASMQESPLSTGALSAASKPKEAKERKSAFKESDEKYGPFGKIRQKIKNSYQKYKTNRRERLNPEASVSSESLRSALQSEDPNVRRRAEEYIFGKTLSQLPQQARPTQPQLSFEQLIAAGVSEEDAAGIASLPRDTQDAIIQSKLIIKQQGAYQDAMRERQEAINKEEYERAKDLLNRKQAGTMAILRERIASTGKSVNEVALKLAIDEAKSNQGLVLATLNDSSAYQAAVMELYHANLARLGGGKPAATVRPEEPEPAVSGDLSAFAPQPG